MKTLKSVNYDYNGGENRETTTFYLADLVDLMEVYEEKEAKHDPAQSDKAAREYWKEHGFDLVAKVEIIHRVMFAESEVTYWAKLREFARQAFIDAGYCERGENHILYGIRTEVKKATYIGGISVEYSWAVCDSRGPEYGIFEEFDNINAARKALKKRGTGILQCGIYANCGGTNEDVSFWGNNKQEATDLFKRMMLGRDDTGNVIRE
jgi:hypothetical protein